MSVVQLRGTVSCAMILLASGMSSIAVAGECAAPYTSDKLLEDLPAGETALRGSNTGAAVEASKKMKTNLACLNETLPPMVLARAYRLIGAGAYLGNDEATAKKWFATSYTVDRQFNYGIEDFASDSPIPGVYQTIADGGVPAATKVEGGALSMGEHFLDGLKLKEPKAVPNEPHLYQFRANGAVKSWIIDGPNFPPEALVTTVAAVDAPPAKGGKTDKPGKTVTPKADKPKADKPKEQTVAKTDDKPGKTLTPKDDKPKEDKPKADKPKDDKPKTAKADDKPGKTLKPAASSNGTMSTVVTRVRPPEKTPLMIAGPAIMLGSGVLYYLAAQEREKFDAAPNESKMQEFKQSTNGLVIASGAVFAVGTGMLTWGIIVDHGAALPAVRFQF